VILLVPRIARPEAPATWESNVKLTKREKEMKLIELAERRWLPEKLIRLGIRKRLRDRIKKETVAAGDSGVTEFAQQLRCGPIVVGSEEANEQHYEVPAAFFQRVLGERMKYSCAYWSKKQTSLDSAEAEMLELTCRRAGIEDGMRVLELGCGWGSTALWMAENYPRCEILAVSNSHRQRRYIEEQCTQCRLTNVQVVTADIADFETTRRFDRVISVEMFEHMRNYEMLLARIANWLKPDGKLFVHIFCHRELAYLFEENGTSDWMARHFFTGGIMPSKNLLLQFQDDLRLQHKWHVDGKHYAKTCEAWLHNLDRHKAELLGIFRAGLGDQRAQIQLQRWRIFFMACSKLFNYSGGNEWQVVHYLFDRQPAAKRKKATED
jgi:cyclopropane-fatty-acyl-phospholipid synthase